jgi:hypothetical protein
VIIIQGLCVLIVESIKMSWKDILKIEPYERAVAEEFAPKDMQEMKPLLKKLAAKYGQYEIFLQRDQQLYDEILDVMRGFPTAPKLVDKTQKKENLKRIYEFLGEEPPHWVLMSIAGEY